MGTEANCDGRRKFKFGNGNRCFGVRRDAHLTYLSLRLNEVAFVAFSHVPSVRFVSLSLFVAAAKDRQATCLFVSKNKL